MINFIVDGQPQGKARARTFYNFARNEYQSTTPQKTKNYEDLIAWSYKIAGGRHLGDRLVEVDISAFYEIPKSTSKKKRQAILDNGIRPTVKPDCDNIIKVVLDALNGIAYNDDKQVVSVRCQKYYTQAAGYLSVTVKEINERIKQHD